MNFSVEAALVVAAVVFIILIGVSWYFEMANEREFSFTYSASLTAVIVAIVTPVVFIAGSSVYRSSIAEYREFWNGLEVEAVQSVKTCEYNGHCAHTYNCDPYWETEYYTDSEGNRQSRQVTKYNSCPYATHEVDYYVTDTLGNKYYFGDSFFLPDAKEWRGGSGLPNGVPREIPVKWQEAKGRLDAGNPGGVTEMHGIDAPPPFSHCLAALGTIYENPSIEPELILEVMLKDGNAGHEWLIEYAYDKRVRDAFIEIVKGVPADMAVSLHGVELASL